MDFNIFETIKENRKYLVIIAIAFILEIKIALWIKSIDPYIDTILKFGLLIFVFYLMISISILFKNNKFVVIIAISNFLSTVLYSCIIIYSDLAFMIEWLIIEFSLFVLATIIYIAIIKSFNYKIIIVVFSLIYFIIKLLIPLITIVANGLGHLY